MSMLNRKICYEIKIVSYQNIKKKTLSYQNILKIQDKRIYIKRYKGIKERKYYLIKIRYFKIRHS